MGKYCRRKLGRVRERSVEREKNKRERVKLVPCIAGEGMFLFLRGCCRECSTGWGEGRGDKGWNSGCRGHPESEHCSGEQSNNWTSETGPARCGNNSKSVSLLIPPPVHPSLYPYLFISLSLPSSTPPSLHPSLSLSLPAFLHPSLSPFPPISLSHLVKRLDQ